MMKSTKLTAIRPLLLLFIILTAGFITARELFIRYHIDQEVLIAGNLLLFIVTIASYLLFLRSLPSSNAQSFIRAMYGSFILKFFVLALAAFIYIMVARKNVNKQALIGCMVIYILYTFIEVNLLLKMMKQKKNAEERSSY